MRGTGESLGSAVPVVTNSVIKPNKLGYKPYNPVTMGVVIYIYMYIYNGYFGTLIF